MSHSVSSSSPSALERLSARSRHHCSHLSALPTGRPKREPCAADHDGQRSVDLDEVDVPSPVRLSLQVQLEGLPAHRQRPSRGGMAGQWPYRTSCAIAMRSKCLASLASLCKPLSSHRYFVHFRPALPLPMSPTPPSTARAPNRRTKSTRMIRSCTCGANGIEHTSTWRRRG